MSGLINKVKDAIHSDKDKKHDSTHDTRTSGVPEGTAGPHNSRAANAADPRVDSDLDSSRRTGAGHTTTGGLGSTTGTTGHTTTGGIGSHSSGLPEGTAGPHSSRAANAADPRVDSDLDSTRRTGHTTGGIGSHSENLTGTGRHSENMPGHSTGLGSTGHSSGLPEGSVGPHSSRAANAADPRVDSDLDSSRRTGGLGGNAYDQTTTGTSGLASHGSGAHGPTGTHSSGLSGANSGSHMAGNTAYGSTNPGPAPKTAGPHKSDMLNKADPRVDSNLDGSKTLGKEKTFETSEPNFAGRDPTDATQVPPSIMQKHVPTEIAHDNPDSDHSRRHSSVNQEHHRGL
ncbi:period circadian [Fusarium longipes]|uniref:Period circadian n=1 Tax=Fusarium longipes TaxID=694270 RepID=A0A395T3N6_9HYPO|nr:period circadian [Fusarium longipes]